jgi:hypothetical protein
MTAAWSVMLSSIALTEGAVIATSIYSAQSAFDRLPAGAWHRRY